jgi:excisionase family DNA binding protein
MDNVRKAYSVNEFCGRNGISRSTVYEEIRRGRLKVRKLGRKTLITDKAERTWLDALPLLELK